MMFRPAMPVKRVVGSAGLRTPVKALCHCETLRLTDHAVGATNAFSRGKLSSAYQPFIASNPKVAFGSDSDPTVFEPAISPSGGFPDGSKRRSPERGQGH
jgi:hypothetical protein